MPAKDSSKQTQPDASAFTVHESVIISLARKAVSGIPGVVRLSGTTFVSDLADLVGSKRIFDRSIVVVVDGGSVKVEVSIVAAYGAKFAEVAAAVQKAVYHQIVDFTGMNVSAVDVVVTDTEDMPDRADDGDSAADDAANADADVVEGEVIQ